MKRVFGWGCLLLLAVTLGLALHSNIVLATANICIWSGSVDNKFSTAGNWSSCNGAAPGSGANVVFTKAATLSVDGSPHIASLTVYGNKLSIAGSRSATTTLAVDTLNGTGDITLASAHDMYLRLKGAAKDAPYKGTITVDKGTHVLAYFDLGGDPLGAAKVVIADGGAMAVSSSSSPTFTVPNVMSVAGSGGDGLGALRSAVGSSAEANTLTFSGAVTLTGDTYVSGLAFVGAGSPLFISGFTFSNLNSNGHKIVAVQNSKSVVQGVLAVTKSGAPLASSRNSLLVVGITVLVLVVAAAVVLWVVIRRKDLHPVARMAQIVKATFKKTDTPPAVYDPHNLNPQASQTPAPDTNRPYGVYLNMIPKTHKYPWLPIPASKSAPVVRSVNPGHHTRVMPLLVFLVLFAGVGTYLLFGGYADTTSVQIVSAQLGNKCVTATQTAIGLRKTAHAVTFDDCVNDNVLQHWQYNSDTKQFASVGNSGECLAVFSDSVYDWAPAITEPCVGDATQVSKTSQQWAQLAAATGDPSGNTSGSALTFANVHSGNCLEDRAQATDESNAIQVSHCYTNTRSGSPNKAQVWNIVQVVTPGGTSSPTSGSTAKSTTKKSSTSSGSTQASGSGSTGAGGSTSSGGGTGSGGSGTAAITGCPTTGQVTGAPSGNTFSGHTYNGHGQTLSGSFTVGPNTCIENYTINGTLNIASGASNITIVNNQFNPNGAQRDIANVLNGGSNITINYNTFNPSTGGASVYGRGGVTNITLNHNLFNGGNNIDGAQLQCTNVCTNLVMSYNKFSNMQSYAVELQQVVHGETFSYNYANFPTCGTSTTHGCGGQYSISHSSEIDSGTSGSYYTTSSSNVNVNNNIAILAPAIEAQIGGACFEVRGTGFTLDHNYCQHYKSLCDYANTNSPYNGVPWYTTNNTVVGSGAGDCWAEGSSSGYAQPGYPNIAPTPSGNSNYSDSGSYPQPPAWNYAVGVQPNVP